MKGQNKKEKKTSLLKLRCTEQEKKEIFRKAATCKLSSAEYMRQKIFRETASSPEAAFEMAEAIRKLDYDIGKIGTNLNQIARQCNAKGFTAKADREEIKKEMNLMYYYFQKLFDQAYGNEKKEV